MQSGSWKPSPVLGPPCTPPAQGADSTKGDFVPCPSGGPLVRASVLEAKQKVSCCTPTNATQHVSQCGPRREHELCCYRIAGILSNASAANTQAENRIRIRFDNSVDAADRRCLLLADWTCLVSFRYLTDFDRPLLALGFGRKSNSWARKWATRFSKHSYSSLLDVLELRQ